MHIFLLALFSNLESAGIKGACVPTTFGLNAGVELNTPIAPVLRGITICGGVDYADYQKWCRPSPYTMHKQEVASDNVEDKMLEQIEENIKKLRCTRGGQINCQRGMPENKLLAELDRQFDVMMYLVEAEKMKDYEQAIREEDFYKMYSLITASVKGSVVYDFLKAVNNLEREPLQRRKSLIYESMCDRFVESPCYTGYNFCILSDFVLHPLKIMLLRPEEDSMLLNYLIGVLKDGGCTRCKGKKQSIEAYLNLFERALNLENSNGLLSTKFSMLHLASELLNDNRCACALKIPCDILKAASNSDVLCHKYVHGMTSYFGLGIITK